jgi:hypothetical protein
MILSSHGIISSISGIVYDADAQAFFNRVTDANGTLSATEKQAVNQLVLDLKANSLWTSMKAIYPMVGASAAACAQNLKSASFTGTFTITGWTFASTGVTPNGTSAYMDTNFNSNINQTVNNFSLSVYLRTNGGSGTRTDMGNSNTPGFLPLTNIESITSGRIQYCWDYQVAYVSIPTIDSKGMWGTSRNGTNSWQSFERNTAFEKTGNTTQFSLPNLNIFLGAANGNSGAIQYSLREISFAHLGNSLSSTQFDNFYTAVQAFQTTLGRQV